MIRLLCLFNLFHQFLTLLSLIPISSLINYHFPLLYSFHSLHGTWNSPNNYFIMIIILVYLMNNVTCLSLINLTSKTWNRSNYHHLFFFTPFSLWAST
ncbi:hypothetical protein GUJ93_ZPchr0010g9101 [Zizania palustris]|uniref:Uncharacterized protein n=1 Tax=Zizania palustris TaxID=103762 RepID=A0A8J5WGC8_ZIZPA|nr:hypothetical protein GUJ93_ZPchr0010g9101 [Zizania palustris]